MSPETTVDVTVRYAESDQMGVAYHANYLVWCDIARTEYLRERGWSYRELEEGGLRLAVVEAYVKYRAAARFDDRLQIRCWVRSLATRRVEFGYAIQATETNRAIATARTALAALDATHRVTRIPDPIRASLVPIADPIRL